MAEPQPPTVHEGIDNDDAAPPALPTSGEDRKAAAAMSSLESRGNDDDADTDGKKHDLTKEQQDALSGVLNQLELKDKAPEAATEDSKKRERLKEEAARRAKVKVDQADVGLLVEELDLNKAKATELLKAHEGDAVKAMRAFVTASA